MYIHKSFSPICNNSKYFAWYYFISNSYITYYIFSYKIFVVQVCLNIILISSSFSLISLLGFGTVAHSKQQGDRRKRLAGRNKLTRGQTQDGQ